MKKVLFVAFAVIAIMVSCNKNVDFPVFGKSDSIKVDSVKVDSVVVDSDSIKSDTVVVEL